MVLDRYILAFVPIIWEKYPMGNCYMYLCGGKLFQNFAYIKILHQIHNDLLIFKRAKLLYANGN